MKIASHLKLEFTQNFQPHIKKRCQVIQLVGKTLSVQHAYADAAQKLEDDLKSIWRIEQRLYFTSQHPTVKGTIPTASTITACCCS